LKKYITNVKEIIAFIGTKNYLVNRTNDTKISRFNELNSVKKSEITFCSLSGKEGFRLVAKSSATLIICHNRLKKELKNGKGNYVFVENPRLWFVRCMNRFLPQVDFCGIHRTAIIEAKNIPKSAYIGPYVHIGKDVKIGQKSKIFNNTVIFGKTSLGKNVTIDPCSFIGSDGFGFARDRKGKFEKFPHIGGVIIGDDVKIQSMVSIKKGTLQNTQIGSGTIIGSFTNIAHNVKIGKNCFIAPGLVTGGSCVIEDGVYIAMSVTIRNGIKIGKNSILGMGAVVTKDVPPNCTMVGNPAKLYKKN